MPWSKPTDALRHTKKATTPHLQRLWLSVANSVLSQTGDDGKAAHEANGAVLKALAKRKKK